jgi:hypothetical protein
MTSDRWARRGFGGSVRALLCGLALAAAIKAVSALAAHSTDASDSAAFVITGPDHVEDTTLRNGLYWGKWNFGAAQFLQIGYQPSTVYDVYHTVSLLRFDLSQCPYERIVSAKLRLYVPRNLTQLKPLAIHAHAVSAANARWAEGSSEAEKEAAAATWNSRSTGKPWAGRPGLSQAGADYDLAPLDTQTADGLNGQWLEFQLPAALAQSWLNAPNRNSGILLRPDDNIELGQQTYIYSSQHPSGKGPQLVLQGTGARKPSASPDRKINPRFQMPPMGPLYQEWLNQSPSRYAAWAKDPSINLRGEQAIYPYLWDIIFRGEILLPRAFLPLSQATEELPDVIKRGDRAAARRTLEDFMKYMMIFDYAREQNWYDSGPTAEVLSPLQVAKFFVKAEREEGKNSVRGIYSQNDDGRWKTASSEDIEKAIQAQLDTIKTRLKPSPAQLALIEPVIRTNMPLEFFHGQELKKCLDRVYSLIDKEDDGVQMLKALRGMFFHHRLFLIHQSLFSMPKYSVLLQNGDILGYAQWFHDVRAGQYSKARIGRQFDAATRYMWKPSPSGFEARGGQLRVDLRWNPIAGFTNYEVSRATAENGPYENLRFDFPALPAYSDFIGGAGGEFWYRVRALPASSSPTPWSAPCKASPIPLEPNALLREVQEAAFRYFYDYGHPVSGLTRVGLRRNPDLCEIGGTGWGLFNLVVGAENGFITREQAVARSLKILGFLSSEADSFHGVFPHWLDGASGKVIPFSQYDDGADLVETGFLAEGLLLLRQYFSGNDSSETEVRRLADSLWKKIEWDWFKSEKDGQPCLLWHWSPQFEWKKGHAITGFNECQIVYLLAMASPTHAVPDRFYWQGWESSRYATSRVAFGVSMELGHDLGPPLFWTHYSYLGLDPREIFFHGRSYFEHFRDFCRVQALYADSRRAEFEGYGPLWGLTASQGPKGYRAFAPGPRDNGTIAPTAALSSMPYTPEASKAFLLELYQKHGKELCGPFGFYDAFNLSEKWVARDYLGNDVGPIAPMIENYRSELCWRTFMKAPEIIRVVKLLTSRPEKQSAQAAPTR